MITPLTSELFEKRYERDLLEEKDLFNCCTQIYFYEVMIHTDKSKVSQRENILLMGKIVCNRTTSTMWAVITDRHEKHGSRTTTVRFCQELLLMLLPFILKWGN